MSATALTASAIELTKSQEGYVDHLYYDAVGVATIGYGTTLGAGVVDPLPASCTETQATGWLLEYMNRWVVPAILRSGFKPNENQLGALADLGYNCGAGVFDAGWSMGNALRSGDPSRISAAFMDYVYAGGQVLSDLVHRREADRALFDSPVPHVPTYHYDWYMAHGERTAVERYDHWRGMQTRKHHPDRAWLALRRKQCGFYASRVRALAKRDGKHGRFAWEPDHRGWRYQELSMRSRGELVKPS